MQAIRTTLLALLVGLAALPAEAAAEQGVTTTRLNLRACAGTSTPCEVLLTLPAATRLEILSRRGVWLEIALAEGGETGWVHGDFVRREPQGPPAPAARAPSPEPARARPGPPGPAAAAAATAHGLLFALTPFLIVLGALLLVTGIVAAVLAGRGDPEPSATGLRTKLTRPASYRGPTKKGAKQIGNFADVVMKGGITSGVIYPLAICELARKYRLRNIGGTSAGAIAAGLAAAAEYARRSSDLEGYARLAELPVWLGGREGKQGRSNMLALFQPAPNTRALFELLLLALAPGAPLVTAIRVLRQALLGLGPAPWLGLAPGLLLAAFLTFTDLPSSAVGLAMAAILWLLASLAGLALLSLPAADARRRRVLLAVGAALAVALIVLGPLALGRWLAPGLATAGHAWAQEGALLLAALGLLAGCTVALARSVLRDVPQNDFGICSGMSTGEGRPGPALAPWLHEQIQRVAGRGVDDPPLTFRDLELPDPQQPGDPEEPWNPVRLRMMTTCLTFGRPYLLPLENKIFYFDEQEMASLFPREVVDFMVAQATVWSASVAPAGFDAKADRLSFPEDADYLVNRYLYPLRPLPHDRLPILVAVRMSLSFPLLLSAVPLWTIDWRGQENNDARDEWYAWRKAHADYWDRMRTRPEAPLEYDPPRRAPRAERCWFSDGGICSNFPVHLFDQLLPRWPTFGINLRYGAGAKQRPSRVELASRHTSGLLEHWNRLGDDGSGTPGHLASFVGAIFGAMQNWADNSILRVPGYRDRIVHLHLDPGEGGLNLDMTPEQIGRLASWGREAGEALAQRFTRRTAEKSELSWDNHRWTRLRSSLAFLQEEIEDLVDSYEDSARPDKDAKDRWRSYRELIERDTKEHPTSYKWKRVGQRAMAVATFEQLAELVALWRRSADWRGFLDPDRPRPLPKFHIRPPLQE